MHRRRGFAPRQPALAYKPRPGAGMAGWPGHLYSFARCP